MKLLDVLLSRRRLVLAITFLMAVAGVFSWNTMPREEDPQFPQRNGLIITAFPGADSEAVERLVVEPIEENLAEVSQISRVDSTSRAGVAIVHVEFRETVYDTDKGWDEVREAVDRASRDFPNGVLKPEIQDDLVSQEAVVLAITGDFDPLVLLRAAERIKRRLLGLEKVKEVTIIADPGEQIIIEYDDATARRLGVDPRSLGLQLAQRSQLVPGGIIRLGDKTANLRPQTEFRSLEEIQQTPILLPSGSAVPLDALARVRRGPAEPAAELMRWYGEPAVGIGVVPQDGLDRVIFGREVRAALADLTPELAPLIVEEVIFQPDLVASRLAELTGSLKLGILIVAGVLFWAMGLRLGLVVAMVVPLVAFASIAIFAAGGGILHQISIAALVIALGMLVDNAIVMAENVQFRIDAGTPPHEAAIEAVRELAVPLGTATGTTLAAFVPMLISKGNTADFTRAIPIMIMLSLAVSYLFAILVTPVLSEVMLRKKPSKAGPDRSQRLAKHISGIAVRRSGWVLVGTLLLLAVTAFASRFVERQFFPSSDRKTVVIDVEMPEGTYLASTDEVARRLETELLNHSQVESVATFVGRAGPKFYYNLLTKPNSPHRAQLLAEAESFEAMADVIAWVRAYAHDELPEAEVVPRQLEQGPPIGAPIELRVVGNDLEELEEVADHLLAELRAIEGTRDVRHDLGLGVPTVLFEIDDAAAGRHGLSRSDVAIALLGRTLGSEIGQFRVGEDPVPILVRSSAGDEYPVSELAAVDVAPLGGSPVPLAQLATLAAEWRPAAIQHLNRERMVRVRSQLAGDATTHSVFKDLQPSLDSLELPAGVRIELGGELEESGKANAAIARKMPLGLLLLLFFLLLEFNSFRRVAIIMVTVPLAAVGVVPGLILSGNPFGFTSMLGIISLVGIVVNNAIVLLDVIESRRAAGRSIDQALQEAIQRRTRPILLTMATTIAGLTPLTFSEASLWPPLAWAMISGLMASTVLTLLVIPALYRALFQRPTLSSFGFGRRSLVAAGMLTLAVFGSLLLAERADAAPMDVAMGVDVAGNSPTITLQQAMTQAMNRPAIQAADARARAAKHTAVAQARVATWPVLGVVLDAQRRDRDFELDTPIGGFLLGDRTSSSLAVRLTQPLLDPVQRWYVAPAARADAQAALGAAAHRRQQLAAAAATSFLDVLAIDANLRTTAAFIDALTARLEEMDQRVQAGRVLEADALKVRLELEAAELDQIRLEATRTAVLAALARAVHSPTMLEPEWQGSFDRADELDSAAIISTALEARPDLATLAEQHRAAELRARAVRAERLPRLEASLTVLRSDGDPFRPNESFEGAVGVTWTPFAAGTRRPRGAALEAQAEALQADLDSARRGIRVQVASALANLHAARAAVTVRQRGVELATETLRVERERHGAGRATTNDLLAAEAELRRQRTTRDLAQLDVLRSWIELDLTAGSWPGAGS